MPLPTPFHPCTSALCTSNEWRNWSGYLAAATYEHSHDHEYFAIRNSAALIDVSPLYKYDLRGPDAERMVNRIITRDASRCQIKQILYSPWCDDDGKVIDDGTVWRVAQDHFRITAADPNLLWFQDCGEGMDAEVTDVSDALAALAIQGPLARSILERALSGIELGSLGYYRLEHAEVGGYPLMVTRTGYTGDLGYELWIDPEGAITLWETLMGEGSHFGLIPAGLVALDLARIEAGLLLIGVDYISSRSALVEARKSTPYELGLGWTVDLDSPGFVGCHALLRDHAQVPDWHFVGLEVDWSKLEGLYSEYDLAPQVAGRASRAAVPIYCNGRQVGQATSRAFSPLLKKLLALASVEREFGVPGTEVEVEATVEFNRRTLPAVVTKLPFFDPPRKRS